MKRRCAVVLLAVLGSLNAQNLLNSNFERWYQQGSSMVPENWTVNWPSDMVEPEPAAGLVNCGSTSCRIDVAAGNTLYHLAKEWKVTAAMMNKTLRAKVRILYLPQAASPNAVVTLHAAGFKPTWSIASGSTSTQVPRAENWQEFTVSYTVGPEAERVRLLVECANAPGVRLYVDNVDFTGTDAEFGTLETPICYEVKSTALSVMFDASRGRLMEVRNVDGNRTPVGENLLKAGGSPLYTLSRRNAVSDQNPSSSTSDGAAFDVTPFVEGTVEGIRATAKSGLPPTLGMMVEISSEPTVPGPSNTEIAFKPSVTPSPAVILERITCPDLQVNAPLSDAARELRIFNPRGGGYVVNPRNIDAGHPYGDWEGTVEYPGLAAMQFAAVYDGVRGLGIAAHDPFGEAKTVATNWDAANQVVRLSISQNVPSEANVAVPAYKTVIHPCVGSWMAAAETYRSWARQQPWWSAAAARTPAAWTRTRPTIFEADLQPRGFGGEIAPIESWATVLSAWQQALASPGGVNGEMMGMFRGFEKNGTYIGPYYVPLNVIGTPSSPGGPYPAIHSEQAILSCWSGLHGTGNRAAAMIAGLNWAVTRTEITPGCPPGNYDFWVPGYAGVTSDPPPWQGIACVDRFGNYFHRDQDLDLIPWTSNHYLMDPSKPFTVARHQEAAARMAADNNQASAVDLYLFDQMNGGTVYDNFDPTSGHPIGNGRWKADALKNLFNSTLAAGKAGNPNFEMAIEDPCELSIGTVAVQGIRSSAVSGWPAPGVPGSEVVPAFQFVYSEIVRSMVWDIRVPTTYPGMGQSERDRQVQSWLVALAKTLTSGAWEAYGLIEWMLAAEYLAPTSQGGQGGACALGVTTLAMLPTPQRSDPVPLAFLINCVRTGQGPARNFLNDGVMQTTNGFSCVTSATYKEVGGPPFLVTVPVAWHSAWKLSTSTGLLVANAWNSNQSVAVTLPTQIGGVTIAPGTAVTVYRNAISNGVATTYGALQNTTLQPQEVLFLVL